MDSYVTAKSKSCSNYMVQRLNYSLLSIWINHVFSCAITLCFCLECLLSVQVSLQISQLNSLNFTKKMDQFLQAGAGIQAALVPHFTSIFLIITKSIYPPFQYWRSLNAARFPITPFSSAISSAARHQIYVWHFSIPLQAQSRGFKMLSHHSLIFCET